MALYSVITRNLATDQVSVHGIYTDPLLVGETVATLKGLKTTEGHPSLQVSTILWTEPEQ